MHVQNQGTGSSGYENPKRTTIVYSAILNDLQFRFGDWEKLRDFYS